MKRELRNFDACTSRDEILGSVIRTVHTVSARRSACNDSAGARHNRFVGKNPKTRYFRYDAQNRYIPKGGRNQNNP